jgi:hypothetical protein
MVSFYTIHSKIAVCGCAKMTLVLKAFLNKRTIPVSTNCKKNPQKGTKNLEKSLGTQESNSINI